METRLFALSADGGLTQSAQIEGVVPLTTASEVTRVARKITNVLLGLGSEADAKSLDDIETALLKSAVKRANGNLSAAARLLGITRPQLAYRLKNRGLPD